MNQITIRNLEDQIVQRLKQLAWQNGKPWEEMARLLLIEAVEVHARPTRRPLAELEAHI